MIINDSAKSKGSSQTEKKAEITKRNVEMRHCLPIKKRVRDKDQLIECARQRQENAHTVAAKCSSRQKPHQQ